MFCLYIYIDTEIQSPLYESLDSQNVCQGQDVRLALGRMSMPPATKPFRYVSSHGLAVAKTLLPSMKFVWARRYPLHSQLAQQRWSYDLTACMQFPLARCCDIVRGVAPLFFLL